MNNILVIKNFRGEKIVVLPQVVLIVRYASDGKLYLYDIQNIKKETSNPL